MNFLAHFLLASRRKSADFHLGALLPDFGRRAGIPLQAAAFKNDEERDFPELLAGMHLHWQADKAFHGSDLFSEGYELWKTETEADLTGLRRKFFLYHLLFEMWLDRILMDVNPLHALWMYESLARIDEDKLQHFSKTRARDSGQGLFRTLEDFRNRRFLLDYQDPEKFAGIAAGVFFHATGQARNDLLRPYLISKVESMDGHREIFLRKWEVFEKKFMDAWQYPY